MRRRGSAFRRGFAPAMLRVVCLVSYLAATIGMPMPARKGKLYDDPYPCQDSPCGCQSARECWTSCRCYSPAERVRWAVHRGVTVPDYAVLPPAEELARILEEEPSTEVAEAGGECGCCSKHEHDSDHAAKPAVRIALASAIAKCRGMSLDSAPSIDVGLPPLAVSPETLVPRGFVIAVPNVRPGSFETPPPSPPPRSLAL